MKKVSEGVREGVTAALRSIPVPNDDFEVGQMADLLAKLNQIENGSKLKKPS